MYTSMTGDVNHPSFTDGAEERDVFGTLETNVMFFVMRIGNACCGDVESC